MSYFDDREHAEEYISMAEGYDGRELIEVLQEHLPEGASLLELGMGPGTDLDLLSQTYRVTGSDSAQAFLDIYREKNEGADLLLLDAATLKTDRRFDGIYSNKVLIHLSEDELRQSFRRQEAVLNPGGILFHSFWYGDKEESYHGLRFRYYTEEMLLGIVEPRFEVVVMERYTEMEQDDSLYIVLRTRTKPDQDRI
jgi:cyclopropane fatty-acyl-phospholipid synthase-like methyltransferase